MTGHIKRAYVLVCSMAVAAVLAGVAVLIMSRPAAATPEFAEQTHKACGVCHKNPAGGGALTKFGEKFKANGNKLPK